MEWETVIGLEVHIQLDTQSKMYSGASTAYGEEPNTQACAIDLALPGTLPVVNHEAVLMAIKLGLAINAHINKTSLFARKNYFYPDLPKGYQISQHMIPIISTGYLDIFLPDGSEKRINITRAHLEEDTGKSLHEDFKGSTGLDLNRAGIPLLEIVSEPDMRTPEEASAYLKALHALVVHLGICTGNMQEGAFRCDANVSVRPKGSDKLGTRTETKNINSFRFVERAIHFETQRQINLLNDNQPIIQETRLFDAATNTTRAMRSKEEAQDYRYFPDPDLLPLVIEDETIDAIRLTMPELPYDKLIRFCKNYQLSHYQAHLLTSSKAMSDYFEKVVELSSADPVLAANWILGELSAVLNKTNTFITQTPINEEQLAGLLKRIQDKTISGKIAKTVFEAMLNNEGDADTIIKTKGLTQVTNTSAIEKMIDQIMLENPEELAAYRAGKTKLLGFFVGQAMKLSKGTANPNQVNQVLKEKLEGKGLNEA